VAKTFRGLWPQLVSWRNLVLAFRKCRRGKRCKPDAARFDFAWESQLLQLQRELRDGSYTPGQYRHFYVFDPKKRKISAAPFRDRVIHHALVNVLEPLYERQFIFDSYACRRNKGTHRGLARAQHYLRRFPYYLKTDVVKFFPSVDHAILLEVLQERLADGRVLGLVDKILASGAGVLDSEVEPGYFPGDDLFALERPHGLPIGNLTSQFFANVLLDKADHFVKELLGVPGYVRYCDDLVLFGSDKAFLREWRLRLETRLLDLRLRLHQDKTQLRPSRCGLKFLGFVLRPHERRLQQRSLVRLNRRLRRYRWLRARGLAHASDLACSLAAWRAHAAYANSCGVQAAIRRRLQKSCYLKE